jgi:hypothetical protein
MTSLCLRPKHDTADEYVDAAVLNDKVDDDNNDTTPLKSIVVGAKLRRS